MILETDQALLAVTKNRVLGNAAVAVTFDPPARPWIQALKTPAVNFFLFDIRENAHRRDVMYEQVRDEEGRVVGHRPPAPRYDLHYTVSVWGAPIAMEHRILALVLRCFGGLGTIPRELLPEALAKSPHEIHLTTAAGMKRSMFLNMAGEVKVGFELTATVAMPAPDLPAAAPVSQVQVGVAPPTANGAPAPVKPPEPKPEAAKAEGAAPKAEAQSAEAQKAETAKPEAQKPEAAKPEAATKPEAPKPETPKPEATKPEAPKPQAAKPAAAKPETTKPETAEPAASEPGASKPEPAPSETAPASPAPAETGPATPAAAG
ncbi:MAG TPA: Pvc16 family protein [Actinocrinis sp.]|nr:Pvc16 family protein [Actinocrinis sp.]